MADPAVEQVHDRPQRSSAPSAGQEAMFLLRRERPRVAVRADLLPAVSILSLVGLLGIPIGWLWAQLAPPERVRIFPDRPRPLQLENWHRFDDVAIYALLSFGLGIVIGAGVWLLRERRGPVALVAAFGGAALAGWLGTQMGATFAGSKYEVAAPPAVGAIIEQAPKLDFGWVLILPALSAALVYGLLAAWNGTDDLGRRLG